MESPEQIIPTTKIQPETIAKNYAYRRLLILTRLPIRTAKIITLALLIIVPSIIITMGDQIEKGISQNILNDSYKLAFSSLGGNAWVVLVLFIILWFAVSEARRRLFAHPAFSEWWMRITVTLAAFITAYLFIDLCLLILAPYLVRVGFTNVIGGAASYSIAAAIISIVGEAVIEELAETSRL